MATLDIGGKGGAAFPFKVVGDYVQGSIVDMEEIQQTDITTQKLAFWDDGSPKMQYRVTLQTNLADPANVDDKGMRSVYLNGSRKQGCQSSLAAVLDVVREVTGSTAIATGAMLTLQFIGTRPAAQRGLNDAKLYTAQYVAPAMNIGSSAPAAAPALPVPPPLPVPAPAPVQPIIPPAVPPVVPPVVPPPAPALVATPAPVPSQPVITPEAFAALEAAGVPTAGFIVATG